ncbi:MAG: hypothetical protein KF858_07985 [Candidatus Sumerlaeia bacterium]|nr:hypothetical protein [Candidatus Sumerlaeia bacterium]
MKFARSRRHWTAAAAALALLLAAPVALQAKIDLVTLPARDETQVTIYKSEDLTLVRETRSLTFDEGKNEIQFSWANTLIDPTSLQIRLVKPSPDFRILDAHYPANTANTIVWTIEAAREGQAQVEITCFASGLTWQADYKAIANADETYLRLEPNFTIFNRSGESFENARTRLVVGEINLTEAVADLARRGIIPVEKAAETRRQLGRAVMERSDMVMFDAMSMAPAAAGAFLAEAKEIVKAAVSEYYLYSIAGTEDLEDGWGKQLPDPRIDEIPIDVSYEFDPAKYGDRVVKFYKFKNNSEHKLGEQPMPEGVFYVASDDGKGGTRFQSRTQHKYVPIGEDYELNLGSDGLVLVELRTMRAERRDLDFDSAGDVRGWIDLADREIEIRNSTTRTIPIKVRQYFQGDWSFDKANTTYKRVDQSTIEWEIDVPPLDKTTLSFTLLTRQGSRASR